MRTHPEHVAPTLANAWPQAATAPRTASDLPASVTVARHTPPGGDPCGLDAYLVGPDGKRFATVHGASLYAAGERAAKLARLIAQADEIANEDGAPAMANALRAFLATYDRLPHADRYPFATTAELARGTLSP